MGLSYPTLLACVRVRSEGGSGSGTILYSALNKENKHSTYVLTNEHVVDGSIVIKKQWNSILRREVNSQVLSVVDVDSFQFRWEQRATGSLAVEADIVAYDKEQDLALLCLRTDDPARSVAKLYPRGAEHALRPGDPTIAVGAAMGEPPVITVGVLSQFGREIDNYEYWLQTAPTIFGNSGGSVFLTETEEFIGVPARIAVAGGGFTSTPITHLSYFIPITRVYAFLEEQMFRFIYDSAYTEAGEATEREAKRKEDERRIAAKEDRGDAKEKD